MIDVLFICKKNETYGFKSYNRKSSGLWNSTHFIARALNQRHISSEIIEVNDNNDIDRNVQKYKPRKVVIEALWVVPEKFEILQKLHPSVEWYVHMHSGLAFLSLEGIAMQWLKGYADRGVGIIANSPETYDAFKCIMDLEDVEFLPNVYITFPRKVKKFNQDKREVIHIGCFGAIRPLKNTLIQAMAAIELARDMEKTLHFHVNATRVETMGEPVLKNLRQLFDLTPNVKLIEQHWMEPDEFLNYLHEKIDLSMQVSLSETFNVVTADAVTAGCPIVVSKEVAWASRASMADDDSVKDIIDTAKRALKFCILTHRNQKLLIKNSSLAQDMWAAWACR